MQLIVQKRGSMTRSQEKYLNECLSTLFRSEDLKTSVRALYSFFQKQIPLDYITMVVYDARQHTLQYRVHSTDSSIVLVDELIRFSEETRKDALDLISRKIGTIYIPNGKKNLLVQQFDASVGIDQPASIIAHGVEVAPHQHAILSLVIWGEDRYSRKHVRLVENLCEPIDSAMRHIYSQLVITRLRERLSADNREMRKRIGRDVLEETDGLKQVISRIGQVAKLDTPVLIMGETGVGKELIANTIHHRSRRSEGPLVSINCGAITESLLDSELFGHEKGAFTGAGAVKIGFFEQADGGSIFLDEVSELSGQAQVKLLRVLQNMTIRRVGGQRTINVDVRVIAATNRDIAKMVENREFRKDLWFRLNTFPITIPPLRERKGDIPALAEHFARRLTVEMNLPYRYRFAHHAMDQLRRYDWPGNVRELENIIEQALIVSRGAPLAFPYLDYISPPGPAAPAGEDYNRVLTMNEMMKRHIMSVLKLTDGRIEGKGGAAEKLGMNPSTLRARMKKLGIRIGRFPDMIAT